MSYLCHCVSNFDFHAYYVSILSAREEDDFRGFCCQPDGTIGYIPKADKGEVQGITKEKEIWNIKLK